MLWLVEATIKSISENRPPDMTPKPKNLIKKVYVCPKTSHLHFFLCVEWMTRYEGQHICQYVIFPLDKCPVVTRAGSNQAAHPSSPPCQLCVWMLVIHCIWTMAFFCEMWSLPKSRPGVHTGSSWSLGVQLLFVSPLILFPLFGSKSHKDN